MISKDANGNADIGRDSDLQPKLPSPNSSFSTVLYLAQVFQHTSAVATGKLPSLCPCLCASYSTFYTWIWLVFRSHFYLWTIKTGTATKIISPIVPLPAFSLMPAQAWILLHAGCNFINSWTLRGRQQPQWFNTSLPSTQKPNECLPRHKGDNVTVICRL